jgi:hypothetical protein
MIRALAAILATVLMTGAALAEVVRVRSGEHPGYSRLVLEFTERPDWTVRTSGEAAEIVLTPADHSFDISRIFERIPRTRVRDVVATDNGIRLSLACDCRVAVFAIRDAAIAIDIADAVPAEGLVAVEHTSSTEVARPTAEDRTSAARMGADVGPSMPPPQTGAESPDVVAPASHSGRDGAPGFALASLPSAAPDTAFVAKAPAELRSSTMERLAEGVARAASQGTLRLAPGNSPTEASVAPIGAASGENLRLRIPGEEDWLSEDPVLREHCIEQGRLDIGAWSIPDIDPAEQIAAAWRQIADPADGLDEDRGLDLARLFISFGFGAEARGVIAALAPRHPDAELLAAMAHVVDIETPPPGTLDDQADCPGRAQLWLALATGIPGAPEDVLVAVSEMPLSLRRHLSARLIAIFLEAGDMSTAEALRALVDRAAGPHGDGFDLAAARLDAAARQPHGLRTVRDLAQSASPVADEALALHLALGNDGGPPPEPPALARAEIRADDLRGTETGSRLETELIMAALRMDDFELAGSRLADAIAAGLLPDERTDALVAQYVSALAERASDVTVLIHAAAMQETIVSRSASGPARPALAQRLADLGFARLARAYLPAGDDEGSDPALTAEVLLLSGDPLGALALLEDLEAPDDRQLRIRADALRALDRPAEAATFYELLGDRRAAEEQRRAAGTPSILPARPDAAPADGEDEAAPSLPALMDSSEAARTSVATMLQDLPRP